MINVSADHRKSTRSVVATKVRTSLLVGIALLAFVGCKTKSESKACLDSDAALKLLLATPEPSSRAISEARTQALSKCGTTYRLPANVDEVRDAAQKHEDVRDREREVLNRIHQKLPEELSRLDRVFVASEDARVKPPRWLDAQVQLERSGDFLVSVVGVNQQPESDRIAAFGMLFRELNAKLKAAGYGIRDELPLRIKQKSPEAGVLAETRALLHVPILLRRTLKNPDKYDYTSGFESASVRDGIMRVSWTFGSGSEQDETKILCLSVQKPTHFEKCL
jgi:hypothetical protein